VCRAMRPAPEEDCRLARRRIRRAGVDRAAVMVILISAFIAPFVPLFPSYF
jgi:hypothetical protein